MTAQAATTQTPQEAAFLALLRAALHGDTATLPQETDWIAVFSLANEHNVLPMILDAAYRSEAVPPQVLAFFQGHTVRQIVQQTLRTSHFLALYASLAGKGIRPVVMKGLICRALYPEPDQRPSNDEDLLIDPADLSPAHEALLAMGLHTDIPDASLRSVDEITYTDAEKGLRIELHVSLFPPDSDAYGDCNALFDGVLDRTVDMPFGDVTVRTMAPTDHLLYLICHAYKHFLHSGVGIRQVCDIAMFAQAYGTEIDWERILRSCRLIRIDRFTAAVFRIARRDLGFPIPAAFDGVEVDESPLLKDILSGGVYGSADEDRIHSSTLTLDAVAASKTGKRRGGALRSIFLPAKSLCGRYPYLRRYPWLLPAAWTQRAWGYLVKRKDREVDPTESLRIGSHRVSLLREYGIIDE